MLSVAVCNIESLIKGPDSEIDTGDSPRSQCFARETDSCDRGRPQNGALHTVGVHGTGMRVTEEHDTGSIDY